MLSLKCCLKRQCETSHFHCETIEQLTLTRTISATNGYTVEERRSRIELRPLKGELDVKQIVFKSPELVAMSMRAVSVNYLNKIF